MTATLNDQGQITIPEQVPDSVGLKTGSKLTTELLRERLERAIGSAEIKWEGGTDAYMAILRGEHD